MPTVILVRHGRTAEALAAAGPGVAIAIVERLIECGCGDWTGRLLKELAKQSRRNS